MDQSHPSSIACVCAEAVEVVLRSALLGLGVALQLSAAASPAFASSAAPLRGAVIINRGDSAWESQQVQEPCILPSPKDPTRLVMFYSGVPATNRNLCFIGKAWALTGDPFTWHQDEHNPVFGPGKRGWDSGSVRLDSVLYIAEEDAYYNQIDGKWYLYAQACPLPENANYIDGHWDLWCFTCGRRIPTLPGCESICIPGR